MPAPALTSVTLPRSDRARRRGPTPALRAAAWAAGVALCSAVPAHAAERALRGEGWFRAPAEAVLATLPDAAPLRAGDLRSGTLSFEIVYDETAPDAAPDRHEGRYPSAIRAFRVRIGATALEMPLAGAELRVSDGGFGLAHRESLQLLASSRHGAYDLRVGWVQIHQRPGSEDLRGAPGSIPGDAIPPVHAVASFPTSGEFDRVFFVRLDPVADPRRPALYLSTSTLTVAPATVAPR